MIKNKGFTIIELLVVISIIALLSSIVLAALSSTREKAKISAFLEEIHSFQNALEIYKAKYGQYPHEGEVAYFNKDEISYNDFTAGNFPNLIPDLISGAPKMPNKTIGFMYATVDKNDTRTFAQQWVNDPMAVLECGGVPIIKKNGYIIYIADFTSHISLPLNKLSYSGVVDEEGEEYCIFVE